MERRTFLTSAVLGAAATASPGLAASAPVAGLIDTNVSLGHWPIRRSWAENAGALAAKLQQHGVTSAWTGSFDGVLHSDIDGVNARLADACAKEGRGVLQPFGAINLTIPEWEEDVRRCAEVHRMPGVRLFPNYHGYGLDDPRFLRLLDLAAQRRLLVQIALSMEDDRSQNPAFASAFTNVAPLPDALKAVPQARVMLLNSTSRILVPNSPLLQRLSAAGVWFEIATLEGVAGVEGLFRGVPAVKLCFGSHAPYFYFEAALLKLQESALTPAQLTAVRHGHAALALSAAQP